MATNVPEKTEDSPVVVELKEVDDKYLAAEREYQKELNALMTEFTEKQKPILEERAKLLAGDGSGEKTGTPALKGFWHQALKNHPAIEEEIEKWDEPVLEYIKDISIANLDQEDRNRGFRIRFIFADNPYFENAVLSKEYHTKESSPYRSDELDVEETRGCTINWKAGQDVTVEKVKQQKTKGLKNKGNSKIKVEPRPSFFRSFFKSLKADGPLPEEVDIHQVAMANGVDADDIQEEGLVQMIMENDMEIGSAIRDFVVPFAVRWYTGEAAPERDDDDSDEDEEEESEDEESDSEDEKPAKGKKGGKQAAAQKKESKPESEPKDGAR